MPLIKARSSSIIDSVDLRGQPTAPTALQTVNTTQVASTGYVRTAIAELIDSSPELLNTLNELAAALGDDPDFATTVTNSIATKLAKAGDTMTGFLTLHADPSSSMHAVTKQYVDNEINNQMIYSTDDVPEGTLNLYYTDARVRSAVSLNSDNTSVLDYDILTGGFTYNHPNSDGILEGETNIYFTQARARNSISVSSDDATIISYSAVTGSITFTTPDTDQIDEGASNLYFTTARARQSISAGSNISYNSTTGVISTTAAVDSVNGQTGVVVLDTDDVNEGSTNLYFSDARARSAVSLTTNDSNILSYNSGTGVFTFTKPNTDAISEGLINQYYTDTRARNAVSASGSLSYNSSTGVFSYTTPSTDGIAEGTTNLYYTDTRARNAISTTGWQISYNSSTGVITMATPDTDDVGEGSTNLYYTDTRARNAISTTGWQISYNSSTGVISMSTPDTDDVGEGANNLYFTQTRARDSISVTDSGGDGSLSYNSSTGVITYTGPSASEVRAHLSATTATGITYNNTTGVFELSSIPNASLVNDSVTVNSNEVALGASITLDTDDVGEGTTNLYYTNTRARNAVSATDAGGDGSFSYNSTTGVFTYTGPSASEVRAHLSATTATGITYNSTTGVFELSSIPNNSLTNSSVTVNSNEVALGASITLDTDDIGEGSTNLYYLDSRARNAISTTGWQISYNSSTGVISMATPDTDDVSEGTTNLYYTNTRARNAVSATDAGGDGSFSYNSATGVFTYTGPSATEVRAHLSVNDTGGDGSLSYDSNTGVFTYNGPSATEVRAHISVTDNGGDGSLSYNSSTGVITYTGPSASEVRAHLSATTATGITYNSTTGVFELSSIPNSSLTNSSVTVNGSNVSLGGSITLDTDDVGEGSTNLYYTDTRVRLAISVSGDLTYNSTTGVIGFALANHDTDDLSEGTTNLYYTNTRARNAVSATDAGGDGSFSYNSSTGVFTYTGPSASEVRAHLSATTATGITYNSTTGVFELSSIPNSSLTNDSVTVNSNEVALGASITLDTDDIGEGSTNLYYLDSRARSAISVTDSGGDGSLSYNSSTGVITYTGPSASEVRAHISVTDSGGDGSLSYNSSTGVITYTGPSASEVRAHLSATTATGITYNSTTGVFELSGIPNSSLTNDSVTVNSNEVALGASITLDTDDIGEGTTNLYYTEARWDSKMSAADTDDLSEGSTNLYYLDSRARAAVSVTDSGGDGSLSYNSSTGVITYTGPSATEVRAHLSAGTGVTYNNTTGVISIGQAVATTDNVTFNDLTVSGNLTVNGTTTTLNTATLDVEDLNITVAKGALNATAANGAGLTVDGAGATITYASATDSWNLNKDLDVDGDVTADNFNGNLSGNVTGTVSDISNHDTDDLSEGSTNLYYTDTRARNAISTTGWQISYNSSTGVITMATPDTDDVSEGSTNLYYTNTRARNAVSATDAGGDGSFSYNSTTGVFTYTGPSASEARAHFSATTATGITYNSSTGVFELSSIPNSSLTNDSITVNGAEISLGGSATLDTDDVGEGSTNLYYLDSRARAAVSVTDNGGDGSLSYNSSTGVITYTGPSASEVRAHISVTDSGGDGSLSYNSSTGVITYTGPSASEVRAHLSATTATGITYNSTTGVFELSSIPNSSLTNSSITINGALISLGGSKTFNTDDVGEGSTNLYYTNARVRAAIDVSGDLTYNSTTGVIGFALANHDTDDLSEGTTNLYYTNTRARDAISVTDSGGDGSLSYNSTTGVITYTGPSATEVRAHLSVTDAGGDGSLSYNSTTGVFTYTGPSATEVRAHLSVTDAGGDGSLSYNSTTGVFTYTGPSDSEVRAHLSATTATGITYNSTTGVFELSSVPNSSLTNDSVTFNGIEVALGASGTLDTDDIGEGTTNLYYTNARARGSVSVTDSGGDGSLSYNSTTGVFTYTGPSASEVRAHLSATTATGITYNSTTGVFELSSIPNTSLVNDSVTVNSNEVALGGSITLDTDDVGEGSTNLYYTDTRARNSISTTGWQISYNSSTGVITMATPDTDDVSEGTGNLYFTNTRARDAISVTDSGGDGSLSYNSTTGVITYTGPSASEVRAHLSATTATGITYNSTTGVFELSGIPNNSLSNSSVTVNGSNVALGASITLDTDDVGEGATNLYYLDSRARGAISLTTSDASVLSYNSTTGVLTFDNTGLSTDEVAEGTTNLYFTQARARNSISTTGWQISYNSSTGVITMATPDTDDVSEGTGNLYFTNARARTAVSLTTDNNDALSYNSTTGVFTFSLSSVNTDEISEGASNLYFTTARARQSISAGSNISYNSTTGVISTTAAVDSVNGQTGVVVLDTDDVNEGSTNLYFTNTRARSAVSLTTDDNNILAYNSGTGVFTFTTPNTDSIDEGLVNLYYTDNRADARIAAASIRDLNDVNDSATLQDGYALIWDSVAGEFVPQDIAVTFVNKNFTGDGTTTSFNTEIEIADISTTQVFINGLLQAPTYSYSLSTSGGETSIVFDSAPENNDYIFVRIASTNMLQAPGLLTENSTVDGGTF